MTKFLIILLTIVFAAVCVFCGFIAGTIVTINILNHMEDYEDERNE